jgi:DNA-binding NtrC family response regulator
MEDAEDGVLVMKNKKITITIGFVRYQNAKWMVLNCEAKKNKTRNLMVMISGHGDMETASIRCVWCLDYISKPPDFKPFVEYGAMHDKKQLVVENKIK